MNTTKVLKQIAIMIRDVVVLAIITFGVSFLLLWFL